jgi:hypothetical protein
MAAEEVTEEATATAFVYLIHHPESGAYKIGRSVNPSQRLGQIAPKSAGLVMLGTIPTVDDVWLERTLHLAFAHRRSRGEWFTLTEEEVAVILSIPSADSPGDLPATVHALFEANERVGFVWGGDEREALTELSGQRNPRKAFHADKSLFDAVTRYRKGSRPSPSETAVFITALEEFLERKGFWPPPSEVKST